MKNNRAEELMAAYLSGNIESSEKKELMAWVKDSDQGQQFFDKAESLWSVTEQMAIPDFSAGKAKAWNKVAGRLDELDKQDGKGKPGLGGAKLRLLGVSRWAAAAAIALLAAVAWWTFNTESPVLIMATTIDGERTELALPDGTVVWLNENTHLSYEEVGEERRLRLEGEAFFDVATDSLRPFRIYAGDAITTVLGTSFNVRAYPEEKQVEVSVKEGKVALERRVEESGATAEPQKPIELLPGDKGVLVKEAEEVVSKEENAKNSAAWKERKLDFNNMPLSEVVVVIQRYYDVEIELDSPGLGKCLLYGAYDDPTLEEVMIYLSVADVEVQEKDGVYHLSGEACQ